MKNVLKSLMNVLNRNKINHVYNTYKCLYYIKILQNYNYFNFNKNFFKIVFILLVPYYVYMIKIMLRLYYIVKIIL